MKKAVLFAIGDEILSGLRKESNCNWLASRLHNAGWEIKAIEIIPDDLLDIGEALSRWVGKVDCIISSGGLGPTHDDKTREAIAAFLGCGLSVDGKAYSRILKRYQGTHRDIIEASRSKQALIPDHAESLYNPEGSALGIKFDLQGTSFWAFPGVPSEYIAMADQEIGQLLVPSDCWRSVWITGWVESRLKDSLQDITQDRDLHISILPSVNLIQVVIRGSVHAIDAAEKKIRNRLPEDCLPKGVSSLSEAVISLCLETHQTVACAESCTGGLVGGVLTDIPGSSKAFIGSAVCYSNNSKNALLGVSKEVLYRHGAVSSQCALMMAVGARERFSADITISVTGIAGPDGGSPEKPAGTVWFGVYSNGQHQTYLSHFNGSRQNVRKRAVARALELLWRSLKGNAR